LPAITFSEAWQEYRRAEALLPAKPPAVVPRRIGGIAEIADDFDLIVLDAWGVLNLGDEPIAGAVTAVAALRQKAKRLMIASNSGSHDPAASAARLGAFGMPFRVAEIASGLALVPELLDRLAPPRPLGLIADPPAPLAAVTSAMAALADDAAAYDRVSAILFLSSDGWTPQRQALLKASLERHKRPLIIGNPDIVSPEPEGMNIEPGWYAHRIAAETAIRPIFCGKPFPEIYERIRRRHPDVAPERVLCVGDTPHTDILGGRAAGFRTLLLEGGFCRGQDVLALASDSAIWPDFIAPGL
jgi:HAD superfamily hydrolase (TIGR01450 family)